jgi:hypothetical protein
MGSADTLAAMVVTLREITDGDRDSVLALSVAQLIRAEGATELLTSYIPEDSGPAGFYRRLGFVPTGEFDDNGEPIVRLELSGVAGP